VPEIKNTEQPAPFHYPFFSDLLGGKFDIHDDWQSPHISHDQGTAADVATVSKSGSCPASKVVNTSLFYAACVANNADRVRSIKHADHVHCNWAN
jgi:hypothetical protein